MVLFISFSIVLRNLDLNGGDTGFLRVFVGRNRAAFTRFTHFFICFSLINRFIFSIASLFCGFTSRRFRMNPDVAGCVPLNRCYAVLEA